MKVKKYLSWLFSLLFVPKIVFGAMWNYYEFDIPDTMIINNSSVLSFENLNFSSQYLNTSMEHVFYVPWVKWQYNQNFWVFGYFDWKPYLYLYCNNPYNWSKCSSFEWFVQKICVKPVSKFDITKYNSCNLYSDDVSAFTNAWWFTNWVVFYWNWNSNYDPTIFCFSDSINYYCMWAWPYSWESNYSQLSWSLWIMSNNPDDINRIQWESSPFTRSSSDNNNINIICPTIWELKKNSGLTKNVCYAWFTENDIYGDNSTFTAWTWLNILQVYEMYSWWMNIQSRYETYREYYKNINSNTSQFENKSKALLGTFFTRQTFWNNKTSFQILNYCNLELSNLPDNATTCTANTWSTSLPLEQASPTVEDITQRITQQQTNTVLPWWTQQNNSWNIQGESIYADIITNTNYGIFDIIDNINSIYSKMTWIFEKRWNVQWIIPIYITWIILLFVLFKLRKK